MKKALQSFVKVATVHSHATKREKMDKIPEWVRNRKGKDRKCAHACTYTLPRTRTYTGRRGKKEG